MFLAGDAVACFELLETHGLLPALLPETAQALASNTSGALRRMLLQGLRSTDARVAADEPVSPAFLYAVLLWPAYCRTLAQLQAQGVHAVEAQRRAADRVTMHQVARIALPRRFSLPMQEIWLLQPRFALRQRKRVFRLLAHPRLRAAFDFLELRLVASDTHAQDVAFWRDAQLHPAEAVAAAEGMADEDGDSDAHESADAGGTAGAGPGKRRRRRRRPAAGTAE
jgi:poly(A) polymerase